MFKTYEEVENFLHHRRKYGIKVGLDRIEQLMDRMGRPHLHIPILHVAGTNGKGSTIYFLQESLLSCQYRVGVFTSPSPSSYNGHFLLNGYPMKKETMVTEMNKLHDAICILDNENNHPTAFEILTALAFTYFHNRVDFLLLETGMGGKEDTTNIVSPLLSIITSISIDHVEFLGKTVGEIAGHKAGIIKEKRPVVVGDVDDEALTVIKQTASKLGAPLYLHKKDFNVEQTVRNQLVFKTKNGSSSPFSFPVVGKHQQINISIALFVLELLQCLGKNIAWQRVFSRLRTIKLQGRLEKIKEEPTILVDSAHNIASIKEFSNTVEKLYPDKRKELLFSCYADKDWYEMLKLLSDTFSNVTVTTFDDKRALSSETLKQIEHTFKVNVTEDWRHYLTKIVERKQSESIYFIAGSFHFMTLATTFVQSIHPHFKN